MKNISNIESVSGINNILEILMNVPEQTNNSGCHFKNTDISMNKNLEKNKLQESQQSHIQNHHDNDDATVDFSYICIKKEHFDVNMIYLKYINLKKENYIEIIYKSPSIFLDGLFFKTPPLSATQLSIFTKNQPPYASVITCVLDKDANYEFINMLKSIDAYLNNYIIRHARDINSKMHKYEHHYMNYETVIKPCYRPIRNGFNKDPQIPYSMIASSSSSSSSNSYINSCKKWFGNYMISFKSYLACSVLETLKQNLLDTEKKYVITFNIQLKINKSFCIY